MTGTPPEVTAFLAALRDTQYLLPERLHDYQCRLIDHEQPVTFLKVQPRGRLFRQYETDGIADPPDLQGLGFSFLIFGGIGHGGTPLYRMYNTPLPPVQQMFYAALAQPIDSSSSIIPAMTDSPPSQNFGSLASSPNGLSSSE